MCVCVNIHLHGSKNCGWLTRLCAKCGHMYQKRTILPEKKGKDKKILQVLKNDTARTKQSYQNDLVNLFNI